MLCSRAQGVSTQADEAELLREPGRQLDERRQGQEKATLHLTAKSGENICPRVLTVLCILAAGGAGESRNSEKE